jgi:hypothetical protein
MVRCTEETTATGSGQWYRHFGVALLTVRCAWSDELGNQTVSVTTYELRFGLPGDSWSVRSFASEEQRQAFLAQSFTGLQLAPPPRGAEVVRERPHPLQPIVGEPLSAVSISSGHWQSLDGTSSAIVMDYLQLQFENEYLNAYVWPVVHVGDGKLRLEDTGYRDALCSLIASPVEKVDEYLDLGLVITFDGGRRLIFPLKVEEDCPCGELLESSTHIWFQGDEPFV